MRRLSGFGTSTIASFIIYLAFVQPAWAEAGIFAQSPTVSGSQNSSQVAEITGVKINAVNDGIEVILETTQGKQLQVINRSQGNNFISDIKKAQLKLPDGDAFRQENPVRGITQVKVINKDSNTIQLVVVGETAIPKVELFDSDKALIFSLAPVEAQKPTAQIEDVPIELIVTAEKSEENIQEVPISITAISEQQLEDAQVDSIQDIAKNTPNFSFEGVAGGGNYFSYYSIRGLGNSNFLSRDAVGFYVDDVPFDNGSFLDLNLIDLERVEVLRGPQSTLYGRNSQAGVVNIISRPPTNQPEFRSSASYGNYNYRNLQLSLSDAIIPDKLSLRLAGAYTARDGMFENTFLDKSVGEESGFVGRAQLLWEPSEDWKISFNATASVDDDGSPVLVPLDSPDPFKIDQDFNGFYDANNNTQALKIAYDSSAVRVTSVTARRYSFQDSILDADVSAVDLVRRRAQFDSTVWSQELRIQSPKNADKFRWLLGGYYESNRFNAGKSGLQFSSLAAQQFGLPAPGFDNTTYDTNRDTRAIFGQVDYKPIEPLTLTVGLRYESSSTNLDRQRVYEIDGSSVTVPVGQALNDIEENDSIVLPRFALEYRFNPNLMAYSSVSRGYKPGGLNPTANDNSVLRYGKETSWNYEIGLKSSWFDDRLTANLALFTTQLNDYQAVVSSFDRLSSSVVNGDARINGVEFEVRANPIKGLDLIAGIGYIDAEFTNYVNPFTNERFDGNKLTYAPQYTYNLAAQYRSDGGFLTRLELQGNGKTFFDDANRLKQNPFALVNARIGYERDNYGVYLFANNLFETEYLLTAFTALGVDRGGYGNPRTFGLQVRANF